MKVTQSCLTLCHPMDLDSRWNSPGQNTGAGSLSLLQGSSHPGIKLRSPALQVILLPAEPPGKPRNTAVGSLSLLQRIFPTQELNHGLLHCRRILYQLSDQGGPRILAWVACAFSRGSSRPRNWTMVSCMAGGFFTSWSIRDKITKKSKRIINQKPRGVITTN